MSRKDGSKVASDGGPEFTSAGVPWSEVPELSQQDIRDHLDSLIQEKRREQEALHPRPKYGAERLLMTAAPGVDWDRLVLAAAMKGHLGDQKAVLVFKEGEPDGSAVKSSFMAKGDLGDIHNNLLEDGLAFHTLEPAEGGALVHVVDTDGSLRDAVLKGAQRYDAEVDTRQGRAEFIGTTEGAGTDRAQRDDARRVYDGVIRSSPVQNAVGNWRILHNRWAAALGHEGLARRTQRKQLRGQRRTTCGRRNAQASSIRQATRIPAVSATVAEADG
jgi:hypothetical protein